MWEVVSLMLAFGALMLILNYMSEPKKLIEDIKALKGSATKIEELDLRVAELERTVKLLSKDK